MSSCSWSRSAYCVSTLCIRSSIEPATIRYRRIIAYIYCSSCLSKRPNDRAQVLNPHNRRLPNLLSSRQSLLTPSFVSSRCPRRYPYARPQQVERLPPSLSRGGQADAAADAVPEHASIQIFAIWITFFARPGCPRAMETSLSPSSPLVGSFIHRTHGSAPA